MDSFNTAVTPGKNPKTPGRKAPVDRFIPHRGGLDIDVAHFNLCNQENSAAAANTEILSPSKVWFPRGDWMPQWVWWLLVKGSLMNVPFVNEQTWS